MSRPATSYIRSRQVQNEPPSPWVRPRSARWKAWEWALASPAMVSPGSRSASAGAAMPGVTDAIRPSEPTSITTSASTGASSPPVQAHAHQ